MGAMESMGSRWGCGLRWAGRLYSRVASRDWSVFWCLGDESHYTTLVSASAGVVHVPSCEGLSLDLDALWARIDEIVEEDPDEERG
jgi:hypothetical protein